MNTGQINVSFSDLTHTGHSYVIPYGIAMVASYALKNLGDKIAVSLFKYPAYFTAYLERTTPKIACFSNYIWNSNLSYEFARQIKRKSPDTIIVFGGPNYPLDTDQQKEFLLLHPDIDFYICREGELPFLELFNNLMKYAFDVAKIKKDRLSIANCHYLDGREIVQGKLLPPLVNLDELPSPYLSGLCDKFLNKELIPLIQTTRGCPFKCTYCHEGHRYFNAIARFSSERIKGEVEYIARRNVSPNLLLADTNFGMYKQDLEICRDIALIQQKYGWPKYFLGICGKNQKDRILKAASIVRGSWLSAAVQSTNEQVLKNVKRESVSLSQMIQIAKDGEVLGANSFSELILCLPGDTKEAHFQSIFALIDSGINVVRSHQLIMLPGAEAASRESRQQYGMVTRFRVVPITVNPYQLFGKTFFMPEIDEICVANTTMPFQDYLECRQFNLTVEIFYNNSIFQELLEFLKLHNVAISSFILNIHRRIRSTCGPLSDVYDDFLCETKELWETPDQLKAFLRQPGVIERYIAGELGNNEQLTYRTIAIFKRMQESNRIAFDVAREMLTEKGCLDEQTQDYLEELCEFSLLRKKDMLSVDTRTKTLFRYDFVNLVACKFKDNPLSYYKSEGVDIVFAHTAAQQELISNYIKIYGLSNDGLGNILSNAAHVSSLYRAVSRA